MTFGGWALAGHFTLLCGWSAVTATAWLVARLAGARPAPATNGSEVVGMLDADRRIE
jgi:hypothetical protein